MLHCTGYFFRQHHTHEFFWGRNWCNFLSKATKPTKIADSCFSSSKIPRSPVHEGRSRSFFRPLKEVSRPMHFMTRDPTCFWLFVSTLPGAARFCTSFSIFLLAMIGIDDFGLLTNPLPNFLDLNLDIFVSIVLQVPLSSIFLRSLQVEQSSTVGYVWV